MQAVRNLFLGHSEKLTDTKALVRDRGSQFTASFDAVFRAEGSKVLATPVRTPVADASAERWIGSLRRELLDGTIIWNQRQLERLVTEYIDHDNGHRPHRALQQRQPSPPPVSDTALPSPTANITRLPRCDGLINEYRNAARTPRPGFWHPHARAHGLGRSTWPDGFLRCVAVTRPR